MKFKFREIMTQQIINLTKDNYKFNFFKNIISISENI